MMHSIVVRLLLVALFAAAASGCAVIGGVFKAGVAIGLVAAIIVVVLVVMLFRRA